VPVDVDLWFWSLDAPIAAGGEMSLDETRRAARFVQEKHARRFCAGRVGMRRILATYTGGAAADLTFEYGPNGKPVLARGPCFNLSHTGARAVLAVSRTRALGVDIELWRAVEPDVATRFFSARENAALGSLGADDWRAGFFRCWTRKEAVIKALGTGLSLPLARFDVTVLPDEPAALTRLSAGDCAGAAAGDVSAWRLHDLGSGRGISGALAVKTDGRPLRVTVRQGALAGP